MRSALEEIGGHVRVGRWVLGLHHHPRALPPGLKCAHSVGRCFLFFLNPCMCVPWRCAAWVAMTSEPPWPCMEKYDTNELAVLCGLDPVPWSPGLCRVPCRGLLREPGYGRVRFGCRVHRTGRRTHSVRHRLAVRLDWV